MRVLALLAVFGLGGQSQALADPTPMTISPKPPLSDIASIRPGAPIRYDPRGCVVPIRFKIPTP